MRKPPETWCEAELGDFAQSIQYGYTAKSSQEIIGPHLLRITDIQDGGVNWTEVPFCEISDDEKLKYLLQSDDLVFARTGATVGKSFLIRGEIPDSVFASYLIRVRLPRGVNPQYNYYFFQSGNYWKQISESSSGIGQPNVNGAKLAALRIPLPPLNEQKRIVAKIEELFSELDDGEESLRRARRQLGVYRQSLLKQAFEGKLTATWRSQNPDLLESPDQLLQRIQVEREARYEEQVNEWEEAVEKWEADGSVGRKPSKPTKPKPLNLFDCSELPKNVGTPIEWLVLIYGELCSVVKNGISQKPSGSTGYKISRISAVRPMFFDYEDYRFIPCSDEFAEGYALEAGDLVFTRYNGARRYVGVCAHFTGKDARLYPDKLIRTRPDLPSLDPSFLEFALNSGFSRAWLETKIRTTAGQSGVSGGDVKAIPIPLCSLPEQQEIVRILDEQFTVIEQNEREIDAALKRSEALRQSILKKAFSGQLVEQDPNDEPASELLARIRAERAEAEVAAAAKKKATKKKTARKKAAAKKQTLRIPTDKNDQTLLDL